MADEDHITWSAFEYQEKRRSPDWYWALGTIGVAFAILAIILGNTLFGVFIIIGTIALFLQAIRKPSRVTYTIDDRGVVINQTRYPYSALESFWIAETPSAALLLLTARKALAPLITIPLDGADIELVHAWLIEFLDEEERHPPVAERLMDRLGF